MSKNSIKDNFIISILAILMIVIIGFTIYFILDVFGIITVPREYSIASLFYSQIEVIATGGEILTEGSLKISAKLFKPATNSCRVYVARIAEKAPPNVIATDGMSMKLPIVEIPPLVAIPKITMPKHITNPKIDAISTKLHLHSALICKNFLSIQFY